jgi:hypothetical protein
VSEDRFKDAFRRITAETPDAPAFPDLETHRATPLTPIRFKPWMAATGAAVLVLVVVGAFGMLGGGGPDLAAPDENTIDYVKLEYSATVDPVCEGGEIIDNGGFDQATIEIWGPNSDDLTLMVATFPDGSTERMVVEGDPFSPERAWGIDPSAFEQETGFRTVQCSNAPSDGIETFGFLNPPYLPGFVPITFLGPPPGYETWEEALDYDATSSEFNGTAVTRLSRTESVPPDGEYRIDFYVSLNEPSQLLGLRYEWNKPDQGTLSTLLAVTYLKSIEANSVSFSTEGLFYIAKPGEVILEEGDIPSDCPVTIPSQGFTPPDTHAAAPSGDRVWFGKDELWTVLSNDGSYDGPRKSVWWSSNFTDPGLEFPPELSVTWTLRNSGIPVTITNDQATNGSTGEDGLFMIAGIDPDITGCWEVTAVYKGASLTYVYYNPEGQDPPTVTAIVPDVVGMTVDNARRAITGKGFKPFFVDSDDALYEVCAQDPADGSVVDIGGAVEMRTAPLGGCDDLMGLTNPNSCDRAPEFTEEPAVYFTCGDEPDPERRPVQREFVTDLPVEAAVANVLAEMLQGPTVAEREAGYSSFFSEETADALLSVTYQDDTQGVVIDFTDAILVNNASTSTGSQIFLGELLANAFQFEQVRSVEFRVNGSCEAFWEFLQAGPTCNVIDRP